MAEVTYYVALPFVATDGGKRWCSSRYLEAKLPNPLAKRHRAFDESVGDQGRRHRSCGSQQC